MEPDADAMADADACLARQHRGMGADLADVYRARLFDESSFGSPEACEAYTSPPPGLVDDIVRRVQAARLP